MFMEEEILIIGVIYNTYSEALRFLKSIYSHQDENIKVVLVDNSDTMDKLFEEKIQSLQKNVIYLKSEKNLGYFGGADFGLRKYLSENNIPKWIIVSNVDIVFSKER